MAVDATRYYRRSLNNKPMNNRNSLSNDNYNIIFNFIIKAFNNFVIVRVVAYASLKSCFWGCSMVTMGAVGSSHEDCN